jgi:hypothetical protein
LGLIQKLFKKFIQIAIVFVFTLLGEKKTFKN